MLEIRTAPLSLRVLTCAILLGIAAPAAPALAQSNEDARAQMNQDAPPQQGAPANPICMRLEGQLATIDRGAGTGDPAKDEQIRRYQEAQAKQQAELDRVTLQAKRMGCESSGFFSLFNGRSAQCGPVNNQIQQMRANLDQITTSLERLRSGGIGGADRENQRRSVLTALAQNNCGPQYAAAARGPGNFIDSLFGNNNNNTLPPPSADFGAPSGTFRGMLLGVRQRQRAAPGPTQHLPPVDLSGPPAAARDRPTRCQVVLVARSASGALACGTLRPQPRWSNSTSRYRSGSCSRR